MIARHALIDFTRLLTHLGTWPRAEAELALARGHYLPITGRTDADLYLLRLWLTPPQRDERGEWQSADSLLLHLFARGDDDQALHDHPWSFRTTIIAGGYTEHLPDLAWLQERERLTASFGTPTSPQLGPAWDQFQVTRHASQTIDHEATDLHCVGHVVPGTITLVRTGPRVRPWGFHPPGRPWIGCEQYLAERKALQAMAFVDQAVAKVGP